MNFEISIRRIHHSECSLDYKDSNGKLSIWVDQSPLDEYDYVTTEEYFTVKGERLAEVKKNIQEWAAKENLVIKVWPEN